jgi:hypothetical protein
MKSISLAVCLFFTLGALSSCATLFNEKSQKINITTTTGEKINANIDGVPVEVPSIVSLNRSKADKMISTSNPKCNASTLAPSSMDTMFYVNIISGVLGTFGSTTDAASEKMWKYQDTVMISCKS